MGRKKRKTTVDPQDAAAGIVAADATPDVPPPPPVQVQVQVQVQDPRAASKKEPVKQEAVKESSGYAMTSHSAEVIGEDIYVSDGSADDGDGDDAEAPDEGSGDLEIVLAGSRMGLMRRGLAHSMLVQPKRKWVRQEAPAGDDAEQDEEAERKRKQEEEEELAKLDPAQRAAKLLAEKQRKLEEAKETARRLESEENAGRDPCLFSKRTAFDIRFDQIDDKPWTRGAGDFTDFFNYGLTEDDWLEYSQQQITIRQELTDAARQRRVPDPAIVPVKPRAPTSQTPKVAVSAASDATDGEAATGPDGAPVAGPELVVKQEEVAVKKEEEQPIPDVHVGVGGAWGAGAAPGSTLAKLIEEQEHKNSAVGPTGGSSHVKQEHYERSSVSSYDNHSQHDGGGGHYQDYGRGGHDYGSYRGRSGGRGGRSSSRGYNQNFGGRGGQNRSWGGGRDDYQSRKRPREDYRGGGGQW